MASNAAIDFDDEMEAALAELMALDGTKTLAIKRSLIAEAQRRRLRNPVLDTSGSLEAEEGLIDQAHRDWADELLDRRGQGSQK